MKQYPPFTITPAILQLVADISENVGTLSRQLSGASRLKKSIKRA